MSESPLYLGPAPRLPAGQLICMIFSYVSIVLYVWIMIVILKYRKTYAPLQSPFYHLLMNQAFTDLVFFLVFEVILRPRKYRYFALPIFSLAEDAFYPRFSFFCFLTLRSTMFLGYVPFALNRFTIFFRPTLYKQIWNSRTTTICALVQWIVPLVFNIYAFFIVESGMSFHLLPNGVLLTLTDPFIRYVDTLQGFIVGATVSVVCVALYLWTFRRAKRHTLPPQIAKSEVRLLICSAVTFIPMILDSVRNVAQIVFEHFFGYRDVFVISTELMYICCEVASVAQPWAILLTNDMIRKLLLGEKRKLGTNIVAVTAKSLKSTSVTDLVKKAGTYTITVDSVERTN